MDRICVSIGILFLLIQVVNARQPHPEFNITDVYIGCECANKTLQQLYCDDEFVITVIVLEDKGQNVVGEENGVEKKHQTFVLKNFKESTIKQWDYLDIYTNMTNLTCGVPLTPYHHYVIGGKYINGKPWISLCNVVMKGYDLPCSYDCDCKATYGQCTGTNCPNEKDACIYVPTSEGDRPTNKWGDSCSRDKSGTCQWNNCV